MPWQQPLREAAQAALSARARARARTLEVELLKQAHLSVAGDWGLQSQVREVLRQQLLHEHKEVSEVAQV